MSCSDCSECGKINCRYRKYDYYDCIIDAAKEAQKNKDLIDIDILVKVKELAEKVEFSDLYKLESDFVVIKDHVNNILKLFEIDTENYEYTKFGVLFVRAVKGSEEKFTVLDNVSYEEAQCFLSSVYDHPQLQINAEREVMFSYYALGVDEGS